MRPCIHKFAIHYLDYTQSMVSSYWLPFLSSPAVPPLQDGSPDEPLNPMDNPSA